MSLNFNDFPEGFNLDTWWRPPSPSGVVMLTIKAGDTAENDIQLILTEGSLMHDTVKPAFTFEACCTFEHKKPLAAQEGAVFPDVS